MSRPWTGKKRTIFPSKASFARGSRDGDHRCGQKADPQCEPFVGVLIEHHAPRSREDTNWAIKGIRPEGRSRQVQRSRSLSSIKCRARLNFVRMVIPHAAERVNETGRRFTPAGFLPG
jgi:hypothetical protein